MSITITDADYQRLEDQLAAENLALRREKIVYVRRINQLEHVVADLRDALRRAEGESDG